MSVDWFSFAIAVLGTLACGALAIYVTVYKTPASEKLSEALVRVAIKLLNAAAKAIIGSIEVEQRRLVGDYNPLHDTRLAEINYAIDALNGE